jgi:hypothetical protein
MVPAGIKAKVLDHALTFDLRNEDVGDDPGIVVAYFRSAQIVRRSYCRTGTTEGSAFVKLSS